MEKRTKKETETDKTKKETETDKTQMLRQRQTVTNRDRTKKKKEKKKGRSVKCVTHKIQSSKTRCALSTTCKENGGKTIKDSERFI